MTAARITLDFPDAAGAARRLRFPAPSRVLVAEALADVRPVLRAAERAAREGAWVAGFVAYEAAPAFDRVARVHTPAGPTPLAWFAVCAPPATAPPPSAVPDEPPSLDWHADTDRAHYERAIRRIREAIAAGDVYQVNHTLRLTAPFAGDVTAWYDALVAGGHGRYCALIETADWAVLSASPELFLDIRGDTVTTRPMKGTARRGRWLGEDRAAHERLARSEKDRAENLMIVDLLRNDLGRVARFGTVAVPEMFAVETYPTVLQMTSTVTATLRAGIGMDDIFAATFPCGSVTGAPKLAAMSAITALERSPRGAYCGAVGVLRPDGSATFNVAIRTLVIDRKEARATYGVGGGITWDSAPHTEYDEALSKAALLHPRAQRFRLLETMRLEDGVLIRLERHLARLAGSAEYFGFCAVVTREARDRLRSLAATLPAGSWRVRLLADRDGTVEVQHAPLDEDERPDARSVPGADGDVIVRDVALARAPVDGADPLLCHKTTARAVYNAHRATQPHVFDVLLVDEHGSITEFCTGNCVALLDGALVTPPLDPGLLAGTFRAELIERRIIAERTLTAADVRRADALWLINSVREWVRVRIT